MQFHINHRMSQSPQNPLSQTLVALNLGIEVGGHESGNGFNLAKTHNLI